MWRVGWLWTAVVPVKMKERGKQVYRIGEFLAVSPSSLMQPSEISRLLCNKFPAAGCRQGSHQKFPTWFWCSSREPCCRNLFHRTYVMLSP